MEKFVDHDISKFAAETTRLQLAGIKSNFEGCHSVNPVNAENGNASMPDDVLSSIADKIVGIMSSSYGIILVKTPSSC